MSHTGIQWLLTALLSVSGAAIAQQSEDEWADWDDDWDEPAQQSLWTGFIELGLGRRIEDNPIVASDTVLEEVRLRLEAEDAFDAAVIRFAADAWYDGVLDSLEGSIRELAGSFTPGKRLDLKVGRQILTWGTGDLLFVNDLFPKDFQSFFAGRDEEYLKAPSDAIRLSYFGDVVNLDMAWMPEFEPDRYLTGERFSFFSPAFGGLVAPDRGRVPAPDDVPEDGELAARLFRTRDGVEWAAYGYRGFFKQPVGFRDGRAYFPRLNAWGASMRRPGLGGLLNVEAAYYDSRSDSRAGAPEDQLRWLVGYERELVTHLTLGLQGYWEHIFDHDRLLRSSPDPRQAPEEDRFVLTTRLTWRTMQDRLTSSFFMFFSPSDGDFHLRPRVDYRYSDQWMFTAGANLFSGDENYTFFGQLDGNDNVHVRARYSF